MTFGDDQPEDAWHPDDSVAEQLDDLTRRARLLEAAGPGAELIPADPAAALDAIAAVVARARTRGVTGMELERVLELEADVAYVRGRL